MTSESDKGKDQASGSQATGVAGSKPARRGFLLGAGVAAGAAGAAAVALRKRQPVVGEAVADASAQPAPERGRGYHVTAHVRKYYDTTKV